MEKSKKVSKEFLGLLAAYIFSILITAILLGEISMSLVYYVAIFNSSLIGIASLLICMVSVDIGKSSFYKYIAITFAFAGMINLISMFIIVSKLFGAASVSKSTQLNFISSGFEALSLVFSSRYVNREISIKKHILSRIVFVFLILGAVIYTDVFLSIYEGPYNIRDIMQYIHIILYVYALRLLKKNRKNICGRTIRDLKIYIMLRVTNIIMITTYDNLYSIFDVNRHGIIDTVFLLAVILKFFDTYYILKICIIDIIKRPNKTLFRQLIMEKNRLRESIYKLESIKMDLECYNEKYEQLLVSLPDGVLIYEGMEIVFANNKIGEFFKLDSPDALLGKSLDDILDEEFDYNIYELEPFEQGIISDNRGDLVKGLQRKFCFNNTKFNGEITIFRKDIGGEVLFIIIIKNIDSIIKLKKVENELEIKKTMEKARQEILSNISHDFKTPVNVIYSAIQMQDLNIKKEKFDQIAEFNGIVKQNCNRLLRLINNFIDSSRIDNDNLKMNKKCINIVRLVEDITMSVLPFAEDKDISLIFDTDEEEVFCDVDIDFMERIMLNLLSNAIKYNSDSGSIDVFIENHNEFISICVKDTGIGIPESKLSKLFNRFDRIDREVLRHKEGSGIGLNIVKNMIEKLNGSIEVISKENEGTTMIVNLPKSEKRGCQDQVLEFDQLNQKVQLELSDL